MDAFFQHAEAVRSGARENGIVWIALLGGTTLTGWVYAAQPD